MEILQQVQAPYDATALSSLRKLQGHPMCLRDFTDFVVKLQIIIKGTPCEEVRVVSRCILDDMRKQFDALVESLRQRTRDELAHRYSSIQARIHSLEALFFQAFISSKREFVTKSDIYLNRCVDVIGSLQSCDNLNTGAGLKEIVFAAVKSWEERTTTPNVDCKRPCNGQVLVGGQAKRPCFSSSLPARTTRHFHSPRTHGSPHFAESFTRKRLSATGLKLTDSSATPSLSSTAPVTLSASSSSDDSSVSYVSETSDDSEIDFVPSKRLAVRRRINMSRVAGKKSAAQRKHDQMKARMLMAVAKQEKKLAREESRRLKRLEKEQERKRQRQAKKEMEREAKKKLEEDKRIEEQRLRSQWGTWLFNKPGAAGSYSDDKFSAAFAKAYARAQQDGPRHSTAPHSSSSRTSRPPALPSTTRPLPACLPMGGIVPNESLLDLISRLEKITPFIKTYHGALRFLGAASAEQGRKNYKRMLLLIHPDKLEPTQRTEEAQRRTCALLDALQQCKARISEDAVDTIDPPKGVTYKVSLKEVRVSWQPCAGAARYEVSVFDPRSSRYQILAVCEPEYDEVRRRYQTIEECTTAVLTPAKFPKLVHLWESKTMRVQVQAISQKGTKSHSSAVEVYWSRQPGGRAVCAGNKR